MKNNFWRKNVEVFSVCSRSTRLIRETNFIELISVKKIITIIDFNDAVVNKTLYPCDLFATFLH